MNAVQAASAIKTGLHNISKDFVIDCIPVADGGDGLTEVMAEALSGKILDKSVKGPRMDPATAPYCLAENLAVIEMARASGLAMLSKDRQDPEKTTTYGTGQLILAAMDAGIRHIIVGLGGSATCDGGIGVAAALGYRFLSSNGEVLEPIGGSLASIHFIDTSGVDPRVSQTTFEAVCDVTNPLTGSNGASYVYSPQKGASPQQVQNLDAGLKNLAMVIRRELGIDIDQMPGAGAAGGLGGGLHAFLGARLKKGIDLVLDVVNFADRLQGADLVLTTEGQIDFQTKFDKAPAGVARMAKEAGIPCLAICGGVGERIDELHEIGINAVFSLCKGPQTLDSAMENGYEQLAHTTEQVVRAFLAGKNQSEHKD